MKATMTTEQLLVVIKELAKAEKVTKAKLALLSRELLAHSIEHKDAALVNQLISEDVLSPVNLRIARLYFAEFMPFVQVEVDLIQGGKAVKALASFKNYSERKAAKLLDIVEAWLAVETNDIWTWQADNVQVEAKPKAYADKIQKLVAKALEDDNEGISPEAIVDAVLAGGVDVYAIIEQLAKGKAA